MTPEKLQQLREKIVLLNHPECETVEEAMEKEKRIQEEESRSTCEVIDTFVNLDCLDDWTLLSEDYEPITLSRVLQALGSDYGYCNGLGFLKFGEKTRSTRPTPFIRLAFYWKLTENGRTCTLEEQTPETQEALYSLFFNE